MPRKKKDAVDQPGLLEARVSTASCMPGIRKKVKEGRGLIMPKKRKVRKSTVVREAIAANLQEQKNQGRLSAYDVMKEACGIIKGVRRDLATNPKYMRGFGCD